MSNRSVHCYAIPMQCNDETSQNFNCHLKITISPELSQICHLVFVWERKEKTRGGKVRTIKKKETTRERKSLYLVLPVFSFTFSPLVPSFLSTTRTNQKRDFSNKSAMSLAEYALEIRVFRMLFCAILSKDNNNSIALQSNLINGKTGQSEF